MSRQNDRSEAPADDQEAASHPPRVAAAAAAAQGQSAKEMASKPRPTRPLSAYNLFFQAERKKMLENLPVRAEGKPRHSHGKIGFADLARKIAARWKALTKEERKPYDEQAAAEKKRYAKELKVWKREQEEAKQAIRREHEMMVQARTQTSLAGHGRGTMSLDAAAVAAGFRDPSVSGMLHFSTTANSGTSAVGPVQSFDDFPGTMQHPHQRLDPAMLYNNTAPNSLDTSDTSWATSVQAQQQRQLIAQERQRAFQQEQALARQSMGMSFTNLPSNSRGMGLGSYGHDLSDQFRMARQDMNRANLMDQRAPSDMLLGGHLSGRTDPAQLPYVYQGQAIPTHDIYGQPRGAAQRANFGDPYAGVGGLGNSHGASASSGMVANRMGNMHPPSRGAAANWDNTYASSGGFASPAPGGQRPSGSGGAVSTEEMARFLRDHFG